MSVAWTIAGGCLLPHAMGGGVLLLLTWGLTRGVEEPARRQRLGLWGMTAALLAVALSFGPAWLCVPWPRPTPTVEAVPSGEEGPPGDAVTVAENDDEADTFVTVPAPMPEGDEDATPPAALSALPPAVSPPAPSSWEPDLLTSLGTAHAAVALVLFLRWTLGHVGLWRLLRQAKPVPADVAALCATLAPGGRLPRLLSSRRLRVPVSCGLVRPTVVLPEPLCRRAGAPELRWALAHELAHLQRRDPWASFLFAVGAALFFPLPWFWWLRRQVHLCQEYVADAAAAAEGAAEDYAQFLLRLTRGPAIPTGAVGVLGCPSDLFRRITMLLHHSSPVARRSPRLWSLGVAGSLLSLAVLVAGVGLRADAAAAPIPEPPSAEDGQKEEPKKEQAKRDGDKKKDEAKKDAAWKWQVDGARGLEELLKNLDKMPGLNEEQTKEIRKRLEEAMKQLEKVEGRLPREVLGGRTEDFFGGAFSGRAQEGRLGIRAEKPTAALADQLDLPQRQGLLIAQVIPESPAAKAGLKVNDVLLELAGKTVPNDPVELTKVLADAKPGSTIDAVVLRKGKKETVKGISLAEARRGGAFGGLPGPGGAGGGGGFGGGGFGGSGGGFGGGRGGPGGGAGFNPLGGDVFPNVGGGVMTSVFRAEDRLTARHQEGNLIITLTGTVTDGKAKVNEIIVRDGASSNKYESVEKVPAEYRDKVKGLVEMSESGNVKVRVRGR